MQLMRRYIAIFEGMSPLLKRPPRPHVADIAGWSGQSVVAAGFFWEWRCQADQSRSVGRASRPLRTCLRWL